MTHSPSNQSLSIARVALPVPLDKLFDYLIPSELYPVIGGRVIVPFGNRTLVGVVIELTEHSDFPKDQLKAIKQIIDIKALWSDSLFQLLKWCASFYQYPLGDSLSMALPKVLRRGNLAEASSIRTWHITELGRDKLQSGIAPNAHRQKKVLLLLSEQSLSHDQLLDEDVQSSTLNSLNEKGWIKEVQLQQTAFSWPKEVSVDTTRPKLNQEQAIAISTVNNSQGFAAYLLEGVTGSGKTEVYLNMLEPILSKGKQALVLVPEIGLTPQTIARFKQRFNVPVAVLHSGLNDNERMQAWLAARDKQCGIIIGTRSALFTPFADLGIIIVDEEHDSSYKQQDTLRYHARDVAVMRAHKEDIPIVLGSATPALETLHNAQTGKYHYLKLNQRAGNAQAATHKVIDIKGQHLEAGLSATLLAQMRRHLNEGNQVMLFLNRRGFSPALMCHECGWMAECRRCDAFYTFHQHSQEIRCHHCGSQQAVITQCHSCGSTQLITVGVGTEQLEKQLATLFPEFKTLRIDRDSTRRKGSLESALDAIHSGEYQILIGTQMLAKGHHFPNVTLVGLIDVDASLYSSDFRAAEKLAQLFIQVAGRAGRASKPGEVYLQTHHPEHALLQSLLHQGYSQFAQTALAERKLAQLPPFSFLSLFRAEFHQSELAEQFLRQVRQTLEAHPLFDEFCMVLGPMPGPLTKRAGKYRWQLLVQIDSRSKMQRLLATSKPAIELLPLANKVRWSLDIEPQDLS